MISRKAIEATILELQDAFTCIERIRLIMIEEKQEAKKIDMINLAKENIKDLLVYYNMVYDNE